jgi:hypothetical protein
MGMKWFRSVDRIPRKYIGGRLKTNPRERKGELNLGSKEVQFIRQTMSDERRRSVQGDRRRRPAWISKRAGRI